MTGPRQTSEPIAVNGQAIPQTAILAEMQYHRAASREGAYAEAAEALVVRELLMQRAAALGLTQSDMSEPEEEQAITALLDREVKVPVATDANLRRYFEANRLNYRTRDLFEASHILYLAPREDEEARNTARSGAKAALLRLNENPAQFEAIARAESRCSSASEGGRLGQIAAGETVPEIDTFLLALEEGQLSPVPVETDYGVHILRLDKRIPGKQFEFDEVKERIAAELEAASWRRAVSGYISLLAASARIEGIAIRQAQSPLVQ